VPGHLDRALRGGDAASPFVAITDSLASPIVGRAEPVFLPPKDGPQAWPDPRAASALAQTPVAQMVARSPHVPDSIAASWAWLLDNGACVA